MEDRVAASRVFLVIFLALLVLLLAQGIPTIIYLFPVSEVTSSIIYSIFYVAIAFCGVNILSKKVLNLSLLECAIDKPRIKIKWLTCAFVLPAAVTAILLLTPGEFLRNDIEAAEAIGIVITAIIVTGISTGIVEEIIFRGLIMKALEKRWGKLTAILAPSVLFGLLHALGGDLGLIDFLMLFIGGTSVGIMFSLIVYRSGSIWNSAIVHGIWNIIMIGDILHIGTSNYENSIFAYKLTSGSILLTGGEFGAEVSIVAILGYWIVISFILYSMKKQQKLNKQTELTI